jgi:hypothetical protein
MWAHVAISISLASFLVSSIIALLNIIQDFVKRYMKEKESL